MFYDKQKQAEFGAAHGHAPAHKATPVARRLARAQQRHSVAKPAAPGSPQVKAQAATAKPGTPRPAQASPDAAAAPAAQQAAASPQQDTSGGSGSQDDNSQDDTSQDDGGDDTEAGADFGLGTVIPSTYKENNMIKNLFTGNIQIGKYSVPKEALSVSAVAGVAGWFLGGPIGAAVGTLAGYFTDIKVRKF